MKRFHSCIFPIQQFGKAVKTFLHVVATKQLKSIIGISKQIKIKSAHNSRKKKEATITTGEYFAISSMLTKGPRNKKQHKATKQNKTQQQKKNKQTNKLFVCVRYAIIKMQ